MAMTTAFDEAELTIINGLRAGVPVADVAFLAETTIEEVMELAYRADVKPVGAVKPVAKRGRPKGSRNIRSLVRDLYAAALVGGEQGVA